MVLGDFESIRARYIYLKVIKLITAIDDSIDKCSRAGCLVTIPWVRAEWGKVGNTRHEPDIQGQPTDIIHNRCLIIFYKYVKI